jgi:hypothetical protein
MWSNEVAPISKMLSSVTAGSASDDVACSLSRAVSICAKLVMPGLVPGIHVFNTALHKTWMAGIGERKRRRSLNGYARP